MKGPTVSVAMATYNGERFLREQLESLARQTLLPYELVACDDGSTDSTLDILDRFAAKSPFPVRVYRNRTRLGYGLNFLGAASRCSGSLIAFCDQDDVWLPEKLQRCGAVMADPQNALVIHSAEVVDQRLAPLGTRTSRTDRPVYLDAGARRGWHPLWRRLGKLVGPVRGCTCVFRSSVFRLLPPRPPLSGPGRPHEPWLLFAAEMTGSIILLPDVLILYRQHERNAVGILSNPPNQQREQTLYEALNVSGPVYAGQSEAARIHAALLADAARRCPEIRLRVTSAQSWYEARAESLARRASLYAETLSVPATARRLLSMLLGGAYSPVSRGGLGIKGLAKDLVMPLLQQTITTRPAARGPGPKGEADCVQQKL